MSSQAEGGQFHRIAPLTVNINFQLRLLWRLLHHSEFRRRSQVIMTRDLLQVLLGICDIKIQSLLETRTMKIHWFLPMEVGSSQKRLLNSCCFARFSRAHQAGSTATGKRILILNKIAPRPRIESVARHRYFHFQDQDAPKRVQTLTLQKAKCPRRVSSTRK